MEKITFKVQRYDPDKDKKPYIQVFTIPFKHGMTVLDGLIYIKENVDNTLSFRSSCRMGICGSCGMLINNLPMLACHTPIEELNTDKIEVKSLPNFPIVRDLVPDLSPLFENHKSIKPYIMQQDMEEASKSPQPSSCKRSCNWKSSCNSPTASSAGCAWQPVPPWLQTSTSWGLSRWLRPTDTPPDRRDGGAKERFKETDTPHGVWLCHLAGACSEACPKGVDPALAIQLLKRAMVSDGFTADARRRLRHTVAAPLAEKKPKVAVPEFTIKKPGAKS